jgi:hypothetical protein
MGRHRRRPTLPREKYVLLRLVRDQQRQHARHAERHVWCRVWGLGFRVEGLGFEVEGLGFGFRVQGLGFWVCSLGFRFSD